MKSLLVFAAAAVFVVSALPVIEQDPDMPYAIYEEVPLEEELLRQRRSLPEAEFEEIPFEEVDHGMRAKRATCDLLSFSSKWVTVNHSACALHCLTKGYKGGKCKNTICNCRN